MTAPPRQRKGRAPEGNPALFTPPSDVTDSTKHEADFEFDKRVVDQVDWSIWRALFRGEFRLATRCSRCNHWLTDGRSKRRGCGPQCAAKVARS